MMDMSQPQLLGVAPGLQGGAKVVGGQKSTQASEYEGFSGLVQSHINEYFSTQEDLSAASGLETGLPPVEPMAYRQDLTQAANLPGNSLPALSASDLASPITGPVTTQANNQADQLPQYNPGVEILKQSQPLAGTAVIESFVKDYVGQMAKPIKQAATKTETVLGVDSSITLNSKTLIPGVGVSQMPPVDMDAAMSVIHSGAGNAGLDLSAAQVPQTLNTGFSDASGSIMMNIDRLPVATGGLHQANSQSVFAEQLPPLNMQEGDYETSFAQTVTFMVNKGMQNARLLINPPELGSIDIQLEVVDSDIKVNLITHTAAAKESLDNAIPRLRELFSNTDMNLVDVDVSQGGDRQSNMAAHEDAKEHSHQAANFSAESGLLTEATPEIYSYQGRHIDGLIDAYA